MIPRLSICFALSVLLHGMLLLSAAPAFRSGGKAYALRGNDGPSKMVVFLEAAGDRTKSAEIVPTGNAATKPVVDFPAQTQPAVAPIATGSPVAIPSPGWLTAPQPDMRQQANSRQMYELQARMQAMQQAQAFIAHVQADIEQSINLHGEPVSGQCVWQADSTEFRCDAKTLQSRMQAEADKLSALRNAMKSQGSIIDRFTVGNSGERLSITYHGHSAADPSP